MSKNASLKMAVSFGIIRGNQKEDKALCRISSDYMYAIISPYSVRQRNYRHLFTEVYTIFLDRDSIIFKILQMNYRIVCVYTDELVREAFRSHRYDNYLSAFTRVPFRKHTSFYLVSINL